MRQPERYAGRKNLPGNYRRVEKSEKKRKKERERERGGDPDPNPRDEKTWLVDQSAEGRKEVPVRGPPTSTLLCVSLTSLSLSPSLFRLFLGDSCLLRLLIFFICEPNRRGEPDCIDTWGFSQEWAKFGDFNIARGKLVVPWINRIIRGTNFAIDEAVYLTRKRNIFTFVSFCIGSVNFFEKLDCHPAFV